MIHVRVHVMGCREGGHMTNFLKWSKNEIPRAKNEISIESTSYLYENQWNILWLRMKYLLKAPGIYMKIVR